MSIPTKELTERFLAPLRGKLSILVLHDVEAKFPVGRLIMGCASQRPAESLIFDVDAFYCANMNRLVEEASPHLEAQILLLSEKGFDLKSLPVLLNSKRRFLVIDCLNSLYSLAGGRRASHQLAILMSILSYNSRANGSFAIATAYRPELGDKQGSASQRSLLALGDCVIDTFRRGDSLQLKAGFDSGWPDDELEF